METEALLLKGEIDMGEQPARLAFKIIHHILIADMKNALSKSLAPELHHLIIAPVMMSQMAKVIRPCMPLTKEYAVARDTGLDRMAHGVNDLRIGQNV